MMRKRKTEPTKDPIDRIEALIATLENDPFFCSLEERTQGMIQHILRTELQSHSECDHFMEVMFTQIVALTATLASFLQMYAHHAHEEGQSPNNSEDEILVVITDKIGKLMQSAIFSEEDDNRTIH